MAARDNRGLLMAMAGIAAGVGVRALLRRNREYDFYDKVVLITGGSRGLGLLLARELGKKGAKLALCSRSAEDLEKARAEMEERGVGVFTHVCDVTDPAQITALMDAVHNRFGRIDVLINNAGVIEVGPMAEMTQTDYEEAMKTHFWAAFHSIQAVLPEMRARHAGRIVNIASIGGKVSVPHMLPYSTSKFALVGFSEGLRSELVQDGIYVTTVCPGLMRTGSHVHATFKGQNQAEYTLFSMGGANPVASMSAEKAARQILNACRQGDPEVVLSLPAQALATLHGLFPGLTADAFGLMNRVLPGPGGIGKEKATGLESETALSSSFLTANITEAARRNNEVS